MVEPVLIGWPNRAASGTYSGGAWNPALPLTNLALREPWKVARSVDASNASTRFCVDLGAERVVRPVALGAHNLSLPGRWRYEFGTAPWTGDRYDSAWQAAWAMAFDGDLLEWDSVNFWEGVVDDPGAVVGYPYPVIHVPPEWLTARYLSVYIDDTDNPDGYVQLGQLFVGSGFQPALSASYGIKDGWIDYTTIDETEDGYAFGDPRRARREVRFATEHLSPTEAAIAHELKRRQRTWGEVLWVPYPHDQAESQRYGFIGRMTELSAMDYPYYRRRSAAWAIREI